MIFLSVNDSREKIVLQFVRSNCQIFIKEKMSMNLGSPWVYFKSSSSYKKMKSVEVEKTKEKKRKKKTKAKKKTNKQKEENKYTQSHWL